MKAEARYTPADAIARAGRVRRGLTKRGGVLLGRTMAYYLLEESQGVTMMRILWGRFWRCSGTHDPRQRATTSLKLGESDVRVVRSYFLPF